MRCNVKIDIYGTVTTPELLDALIDLTLENSRNIEWQNFVRKSSADAAVAMAHILTTVVSDASPLSISIRDTSYCFEDIRTAARLGGLGYRVLTSEGDSEYCYAFLYRPGWSEERRVAIVSEDSPLIVYKDIKEAMSTGIEAVRTLVEAAEASLLPQDCRLIIPESVKLDWKASYDEHMGVGRGITI